jgi:ComF family protein
MEPEQKQEETETLSGDFQTVFETVTSDILCGICVKEVSFVESPICKRCGCMFESKWDTDHFCGTCLGIIGKKKKVYSKARAAALNEKTLRTLIHCFKYNGKIRLAEKLSEILFFTFLQYWRAEEIDLVVPVPLHDKRFRSRGFNQAYLLIRSWPKLSRKYKMSAPDVFRGKDAIRRIRWTRSQVGLGPRERKNNVKNAFVVADPEQVSGKKALLIDDVFTTGATVDECTRILMKSGAVAVDVLTLARGI